MPTRLDLTGQTFGRWTVLRPGRRVLCCEKHWLQFWFCRCQCGTEREITGSSLYQRRSQSCGCRARELAGNRARTHGRAGSPVYSVWQAMLRRCYYLGDRYYSGYGGRGITVCERWRTSFAAFLADMGERPSPKHQLDRIDNSGGYSPGNCRWATAKEQANNRRSNHLLTHDGHTRTLLAWSEIIGVHYTTILRRLKKGWPLHRVLAPPGARKR